MRVRSHYHGGGRKIEQRTLRGVHKAVIQAPRWHAKIPTLFRYILLMSLASFPNLRPFPNPPTPDPHRPLLLLFSLIPCTLLLSTSLSLNPPFQTLLSNINLHGGPGYRPFLAFFLL